MFLSIVSSVVKYTKIQLMTFDLLCVMLQARRMLVKLDIYRKFTNALAVAVIVSVGWICYEVIKISRL